MGKKAKGKTKGSPAESPAPTAKPPAAGKRRRGSEDDEDALREAMVEAAEGQLELEFEDPYPDEFEEELGEGDEDDDGEDEEGGAGGGGGGSSAAAVGAVGGPVRPWRRGIDELPDGEQLEYDPSAYHMYHAVRVEWPCLSFDFLRDALGANRTRFPHTVTLVAGTQADRADRNKLTLLKLSHLHCQRKEHDSDSEGSDDGSEDSNGSDAEDQEPVVEHTSVAHAGGVNRVRSMPQQPHIVASWAETGKVHIWDLQRQLAALEAGTTNSKSATGTTKPAYTLLSHPDEGFAMDWSPVEAGQLATGDSAGNVFLCRAAKGGWTADPSPFLGHAGSVEDLQWSPSERTVFASASADRTVAIWDTRRKGGSMLKVEAHGSDVNVIAWNRGVHFLLASGADDGGFKVWDLRSFGGKGGSGALPEPVAMFSFHAAPITSVEWHTTDDSMLAVTGADNQLTVWDLSVEADDDEAAAAAADSGDGDGGAGGAAFPAQLMFVHQGQRDIKELHYHPQVPGVIMSTAEDGFNIFKPAISA